MKCKIQEQKEELHKQFKNYRNQIVNLLRISKKNHYKNFFDTNIKNSKMLWKGIREIIQTKTSHPNNIFLDINNFITSEPGPVSSSFNDFFTSIASKIRSNIPSSHTSFKSYLMNSPQNSFFLAPTNGLEVANIIKSLSPKKASGPYSIPYQVLLTILPDISNILANIFNLSFETGSFINSLKLVKVIPIFKEKGSPLKVNNYRPISLLANIAKVLEKLVHQRLIAFLNNHNLL